MVLFGCFFAFTPNSVHSAIEQKISLGPLAKESNRNVRQDSYNFYNINPRPSNNYNRPVRPTYITFDDDDYLDDEIYVRPYRRPYRPPYQPYQPYPPYPAYLPYGPPSPGPPGPPPPPPTSTTTTPAPSSPVAPIGYMLVDTYNSPNGQSYSKPIAFFGL